MVPSHDIEFKDFTIEKEDIKEFIKKSDFDVFVFHSVLLSRKLDVKIAKIIRKLRKNAFIIFFGPEPTRTPKEFILDKNCFVVRGEAEIIFRNLIEALDKKGNLNKIKGLSYKKGKKIINNKSFGIIEDIDVIPFPNRKLIEKYKNEFYNPKLSKKPYTVILTSRGCAFRCYFCVPNSISWARELEWKKYHDGKKPPIKIRSAKDIIKEFEEISKLGYKSIFIMDDMFLWGKKRIKKILNGIKKFKIEFGILSRVDFIEEETARLLKKAGCKFVALGVESFNQEVLDYVKKDIKVENIYKSIKILKKVGIEPEINLMFGTCPLETKEDVMESIEKAINLGVDYVLFSIATPFPGTELQKVAEKENWLIKNKYKNLTKNLDPASKALMNLPNLSSKELEELEKYAKRRFYLRRKVIMGKLKEIKNFDDFVKLLKTAKKILK